MVTEDFTKPITFHRKLIGTTENITYDTIITHIFTTLSKWYGTTIQILQQRMPAPTAQQCMDVIHEYAEWSALTREIWDASTWAALNSCGRNPGNGRKDGGQRGGWGNGRQKHNVTKCNMDNHTTEACGKSNRTENVTNTGYTSTSRNEEWTCYHCSLSGHFKSDCIHLNNTWDQHNQFNMGNWSLATACDCDLMWLANNATTLAAASAPAAWVIHSGASHHMFNDWTRFNSIKRLHQPVVIELVNDNEVTVSHHELFDISQEYKVNAHYTPMFQLSLLSINQMDTAGYTSTCEHGKWSKSSSFITITGNRVNDL